MDKQKAIEAIHNLGGCDATEEWSKGYDAGITAPELLVLVRPLSEKPVGFRRRVVHR